MQGTGLLETLAHLLESGGIDLTAWGLAWARALPVVVLVPAFGLRALSAPVRASAALLFAAVIVPAMKPPLLLSFPFPALLLAEFARGTLIAVAAAIPLWAATMAGGIVDALRGSQDLLSIPTVEGRASPLGVLFSLLAAAMFLAFGGPAHIVGALATAPWDLEAGVARAAGGLARGIGIATAVAAPLIAASLVLEIAGSLVARAASPAHLHALLAPVRSLALLFLVAIFFERIAAFLAWLQG